MMRETFLSYLLLHVWEATHANLQYSNNNVFTRDQLQPTSSEQCGPKSIVYLAFNFQGCWQIQRIYRNWGEQSESLRFQLKQKERKRSQDSSVDLMLSEHELQQLNPSTSGDTEKRKTKKGCREGDGDVWEQIKGCSLLNWWRQEGIHCLSLQTRHWLLLDCANVKG